MVRHIRNSNKEKEKEHPTEDAIDLNRTAMPRFTKIISNIHVILQKFKI
jgi:hypothetical protein